MCIKSGAFGRRSCLVHPLVAKLGAHKAQHRRHKGIIDPMPALFSAHPQRRLFATFFVYSFALGGIYPRLGDIQLAMGIREGALGLALMGLALGTQISLMFANKTIEHLGYRRTLAWAVPALALTMALASYSPTPLVLFFMLALAGLAVGAIEIVINVEADRTEHLIGKRVMNRAHAFWSFGFFAAGLFGAAARQLSLSPPVHLLIVAVMAATTTRLLVQGFAPSPPRVQSDEPHPVFVRPTGPILILVAFTLSAMILEGAGADWSVIFMRDTFETLPFVSALAFAAGALAQALGRYFADRFVERFGPVRVARTLLSLLGVGATLVTFAPAPWVAFVGFFAMGLGTSAIFPLAMSAAAQRTDRAASVNVAALAQLAFISFLVAPPLLGYVAQHLGIRFAFAIGLPFVLLSLLVSRRIAPPRKADR